MYLWHVVFSDGMEQERSGFFTPNDALENLFNWLLSMQDYDPSVYVISLIVKKI